MPALEELDLRWNNLHLPDCLGNFSIGVVSFTCSEIRRRRLGSSVPQSGQSLPLAVPNCLLTGAAAATAELS